MGLKKRLKKAVKRVKATGTKIGKKYGKQIVGVAGAALGPVTFGLSTVAAAAYVKVKSDKDAAKAQEKANRRALREEQEWLEANAPAKSNMFAPIQYAPPVDQSGAHTPIRRGGVVGWFNRLMWGT